MEPTPGAAGECMAYLPFLLRTKPLPVGTLNFMATTGVNWNNIGATSIVTMIPPMVIFLALGKYIVRGLTFGAVKG